MISKVGAATDSGLATHAASTASVGAAVIHFAVMPVHWLDWLPSGLFFATAAVFQLMWALLAWTRPPAILLAVGIVGNAGLAALWVVSRTEGLPLGPHAGEPEVVQAAGICALLLECYVVMGAAWAWLRADRAEPVTIIGAAMVLLIANSVIAVVVTLGVASGLQNHDHRREPAQAQHPQGPPEHNGHHHEE